MTTTEPKLPRINDTRLLRRTEVAGGVNSLTSAVLQAVDGMTCGALQPIARPDAGVAYHPRTLLALLTYAYALGVYASSEVEAMMRADANFRRLCGGEFPHEHALKRFRRANADAIRNCLEQTLKIISKGERNQPVYVGVLRSAWKRDGNQQGESWDDVQIAAEATERVDRAIWIDSMALDDCE